MTNNLIFSIIIPVHYGQKTLSKCLTSILLANPAPDEIILVSDGKQVEIDEVNNSTRIKKIKTPYKSGPAAARNLGAKQAKGDIVCFIDSDITIPKNLVGKMLKVFEQDHTITALFGSYDTSPGAPNFLSQYRNLLHHQVHQSGNDEAATFWSGCGAIRRNIFLKLGGFNVEKYPDPSIEDIELGYRLKKASHRILLCKNIQVKHLKKWEAWNMMKVDFFKRALPWTKLILEQKKIINDLNLRVSNRLSVLLSLILSLNILLMFLYSFNLGILLIPIVGCFLMLNYDLYQFFYKEKGYLFVLRVIPWHILFYFTSGLAFFTGFIDHHIIKNIHGK